MNQPTLPELESLARQAGDILRAGYNKEHQVSYKGVIDLVTEVDRASEDFLLKEINQHWPGGHIMAEESGVTKGDHEHSWFVDPLDGTVNYAHRIPIFSVSIAYANKGVMSLGVVYDPMRDELFSAERGKGAHLNGQPIHASDESDLQKSLLVTGFPYDAWNTPQDNFANFVRLGKMTQGVRRLGSAALDASYVAAGRFDGFWELSLKPWDVAAGGIIAEEAGAIVTNVNGEKDYLSAPQSIIAAAPGIHDKLAEALKST
ncbi:MAG TPA: inositol monophosphatase family protein [Anaerolineales bacterium]|nr:inositol monophosphatase family protein [Anaerolineales bacterium]